MSGHVFDDYDDACCLCGGYPGEACTGAPRGFREEMRQRRDVRAELLRVLADRCARVASGNRRGQDDSDALNVRTVVGTDSTQTSAPEAFNLAGEAAPGAEEDRMVSELVARGKRSGNATRARRRAERAIAEGRTPGKPGPAPAPLTRILARVRELVEARDPEALAALAALVPEAGDLQ